MLGEFLLAGAHGLHGAVEDDRAAGCRALVDGENEAGHGPSEYYEQGEPAFTPPPLIAVKANAWPPLLFAPALDQVVVVHGLRLFLLVLRLQLRREMAGRDRGCVLLLERSLLGELRADVALHTGAFETLEHAFLL